jgi:hypothetical protein
METQEQNTVTAPAVETVTGTIKELSVKFGLDILTTRGALNFLAAKGQVKTLGKRVAETPHRGKPATLFQVNKKITLSLE